MRWADELLILDPGFFCEQPEPPPLPEQDGQCECGAPIEAGECLRLANLHAEVSGKRERGEGRDG